MAWHKSTPIKIAGKKSEQAIFLKNEEGARRKRFSNSLGNTCGRDRSGKPTARYERGLGADGPATAQFFYVINPGWSPNSQNSFLARQNTLVRRDRGCTQKILSLHSVCCSTGCCHLVFRLHFSQYIALVQSLWTFLLP